MKDGEKTKCDCGHIAVASGCTTGYGQDKDGRTYCFECCGKRDREAMVKDGRIVLYLTHDPLTGNYSSNFGRWLGGNVSNWPGTLKFPCRVKVGYHNMAGRRYDVWFKADGANWHGVSYGDNSQLCYCRRTVTAATPEQFAACRSKVFAGPVFMSEGTWVLPSGAFAESCGPS